MNSQDVKVVFKPLSNCLVNLPSQIINPILSSGNILIQNIIIQLTHRVYKKKTIHYCGYNGYFSNDPRTIEIDPSFASSISIKENDEITIQLLFEFPKISSVELEPATSSDWELTELYAQTIEDKFLNQIRCVSLSQSITVFPNLNSNNIIKYNVKSIKSESDELQYGKLVNFTELHIQPKVFRRQQQSKSSSSKKQRSVSSRRSSQLDSIPSCLARGIALPHPIYSHLRNTTSTNYEVFLNLDQSIVNPKFKKFEFVQVSIISGPGTPNKIGGVSSSPSQTPKQESTEQDTPSDDQLATRKVIAKLTHDPSSIPGTIALSKLLSVALGAENRVGDLVCVESVSVGKAEKVGVCKIHKFTTVGKTESDKVLKHDEDKKLKESLIKKEFNLKIQSELNKIGIDSGCPITKKMKLPIIPGLLPQGGYIDFSDVGKHKHNWFVVGDKLPNFELAQDEVLVRESYLEEPNTIGKKDDVIGQDKLIKKMQRVLKRGNSTLLYGSSGSGKTIFVEEIAERLKLESGIYIKTIDCDNISNDNINNMKNLIDGLVKEANWHSPSLLILENIDSLIPQEIEHGDSGTSRQISELICNKFSKLINERKFSILITSKNKNSINSIIFQKHLIETDFHLKVPDKDQRFELIKHYLSSEYAIIVDDLEMINEIVAETEGYSPSDLKTLTGRAYHDLVASNFEITNSTTSISLTNFTKALNDFTPSSLRGVKLQKSTTSWNEIGGLKEAKQVLLETLEWPTKYAPIFKNCPLRLRSGILLYGYPGCGKTLLASAISSQCGLNFISIKGPEILNKYIGASEQSVRELFERASGAKPCILFFDEFDSIAPKRGHDSTGVTDRIVNQLLTQMDGAEGLDGVYVLAATSRPDLIDSALLRPGRLDKSIICDLPDFENRLDIIETVIKNKFLVDDSVDLKWISGQTEGYSGADLQALVYNSYLKAIHENLEETTKQITEQKGSETGVEFFMMMSNELKLNSLDSKKLEVSKKLEAIYSNMGSTKLPKGQLKADSKPQIQIRMSMKHLKEGLSETKKSVSNKELAKFKQIYSQFIDGKREGQLPNGEASQDVGGRVTLM